MIEMMARKRMSRVRSKVMMIIILHYYYGRVFVPKQVTLTRFCGGVTEGIIVGSPGKVIGGPKALLEG